jgi:hypothetical protein
VAGIESKFTCRALANDYDRFIEDGQYTYTTDETAL